MIQFEILCKQLYTYTLQQIFTFIAQIKHFIEYFHRFMEDNLCDDQMDIFLLDFISIFFLFSTGNLGTSIIYFQCEIALKPLEIGKQK